MRKLLIALLLLPIAALAQSPPVYVLGSPQKIQLGAQGTLTIAGAQSAGNAFLSVQNGFVNGTTTDAFPSPNALIFNDQVNSTNSFNEFEVINSFGGGNTEGNRAGILANLKLTGTPNASDASQQNYVAGLFLASTNSPAKTGLSGGGAYTGYAGSLWGSNPDAFLASGATNWMGIYGSEFDVSVPTGSNVAEKYGVFIVQGATDASRGSLDDAGLEFGNQVGAASSWLTGIEFGGTRKLWPFSSTSTLIKVANQSIPGAGTSPILNGIDLSLATISGFAFKSPGFSVDGSGNLIAASYTSGSTAGVSCAANTVSLTTLVVTNGIVTHC